MNNIIDLDVVRNQIKEFRKRVLQVDFKARGSSALSPEMYLTHSGFKNDNLIIQIRNQSNESDLVELAEDPYRGDYLISIGNRKLSINYAEALDLYVLLNTVYSRVDGISSITTLLEE